MKNSFITATRNGALFVLLFMIMNFISMPAFSQDEDKFNFNVSLNSDRFFGFYPFFQGGYDVSDKTSFTFYGILWSGGTGAAWGNWTEFGVGLNFEVADGLGINPQIGILGGNLLSSGTSGKAVLGDGIVPNLTVNLLKEKVEGQLYGGFYLPLRDKAISGTSSTLSYLHYWANLGYRPSGFFSFGAHYEHLINTGGSEVSESTDVYQWLGPYVQFSKPGGGPYARFSFGTDLVDDNDSFFKLTTGFSF
jgi:hypothetical protein